MIDLSLSVFDHAVIAAITGLFIFIVPLVAEMTWEKIQTKRHIGSALKLANTNNHKGKKK